MSHIVVVTCKVHDPVSVAAACQRLNLAAPVHGTAQLFSGEATGLLIRFPGWEYPAVIDTLSGTVKFDIFEGAWGNRVHLDKFLQMYAVERAKLEARKRGHTFSEQALQDGSIRLQINEGSYP